jgi:hypothetical protein
MAPVQEDKPKGGVTYAHQDKLPKLPIPELEASCQRYLTALKPLQSLREHADTKHAVQEFLKHDGPELQEKLKKYAEGRSSYIEQFCKSRPALRLKIKLGIKRNDWLTVRRVRLVLELRQPSGAQPQPLLSP